MLCSFAGEGIIDTTGLEIRAASGVPTLREMSYYQVLHRILRRTYTIGWGMTISPRLAILIPVRLRFLHGRLAHTPARRASTRLRSFLCQSTRRKRCEDVA